MTVWIAVASAVRARLFETTGRNKPWVEEVDLVNPEDRLAKKEFRSGEAGRTVDVQRGQRHTIGMTDNPKSQVAEDFAARVVDYLTQAMVERRLDRLCIVAPPRFLGTLRARMNRHLKNTLVGVVRKDLTAAEPAAIYRRVASVLWPRERSVA